MKSFFYEDVRGIQRERFGFYFLSLSLITGLRDFNELVKLIIEKDFLHFYDGSKNEDYGIDAVYVDNDNSKINLFTFKYRENPKNNSTFSTNDIVLANKFINQIDHSEDVDDAPSTRIILSEIDTLLNDYSTNWEIILYAVSNNHKKIDILSPELNAFRKSNNNMKIKVICLEDFSKFFTIKPETNNALFVVGNESLLTYEENKKTTSKSYVVTLPLIDLIRITSLDAELRLKPAMEDAKTLQNSDLDRGVLFDNVRGYLGSSSYNKNIIDTLKNEPSKFFLYNNGITITADDMNVQEINNGRQFKIEISNYQIVNGGGANFKKYL